jgi:hypothetical protein
MKVGKSHTALGQIAELMSRVNPIGDNPHGECEEFANECAKVLVMPDRKETLSGLQRQDESSDEDVEGAPIKQFKEAEGQKAKESLKQEIWGWMTENLGTEAAYAFHCEDHSWNVVRNKSGTLFLIDCSVHCFKEMHSAGDCSSPPRKGRPSGDLLLGIEDSLSIEHWGPLAPKWRECFNSL